MELENARALQGALSFSTRVFVPQFAKIAQKVKQPPHPPNPHWQTTAKALEEHLVDISEARGWSWAGTASK